MLQGGICSSEFKAIPLISICPDFAAAKNLNPKFFMFLKKTQTVLKRNETYEMQHLRS